MELTIFSQCTEKRLLSIEFSQPFGGEIQSGDMFESFKLCFFPENNTNILRISNIFTGLIAHFSIWKNCGFKMSRKYFAYNRNVSIIK